MEKTSLKIFVLSILFFSIALTFAGGETKVTEFKSNLISNINLSNQTNITINKTNETENNITNSDIHITNDTELGNTTDFNLTNETENGLNITINDSNFNITINDSINFTDEGNITINETIVNETIINETIINETIVNESEKNDTLAQLDSFVVGSFTKTYIYAGTLAASKSSENPQETTYYVQDHLGSNKAVLRDGEVKQGDDFYSFGEEKFNEGLSENDYLYNGKEIEREYGLYYYGARYYSPELGRFVQADTLKGDVNNPLSLNRYSYVENNPLRYLDPSGNKKKDFSVLTSEVYGNDFVGPGDPKTIRDYEATKKFKAAFSLLYSDKDASYVENSVEVGVRNFEEDYPSLSGIGAAYKGYLSPPDSVLIDSIYINGHTDIEEFGLVVGNEGGNIANRNVNDNSLSEVWNEIKKIALEEESEGIPVENRIATRLVNVISKYSASNSNKGDEAVSTINHVIISLYLTGDKDKIPNWMWQYTNMEKARQNPEAIKTAKEAYDN